MWGGFIFLLARGADKLLIFQIIFCRNKQRNGSADESKNSPPVQFALTDAECSTDEICSNECNFQTHRKFPLTAPLLIIFQVRG